jgi:hypothetical protein
VTLLALVGDCFWHTDCTFHILSYPGELGDIKMLGQDGLKTCSLWVNSFMKLLDKCSSQQLWIAVWLLANFHHPPNRKFSSLVLNQHCSCGVYHGSHSYKGHRNKAAVSEAEVYPPVRAAYLASLSAFQFPQTAVVSPFWCPWQCMTATCLGAHTASSNSRIFCPYLAFFPPELISSLSLYRAPWTWMVVKAYLES